MPFNPLQSRASRLGLLLSLSVAQGCAPQVEPVQTPSSVSAADVKVLLTPKPIPSDDILTDAAANDRHNVAIETWGETLSKAGARVCRALAVDGFPLGFTCPAP